MERTTPPTIRKVNMAEYYEIVVEVIQHIRAWAKTMCESQGALNKLGPALSDYRAKVLDDSDTDEHDRAHQEIKRIKSNMARLEVDRKSHTRDISIALRAYQPVSIQAKFILNEFWGQVNTVERRTVTPWFFHPLIKDLEEIDNLPDEDLLQGVSDISIS
ncbi:hypothetical protein GQX73_g8776 [Xylaria multiplex]|uniref:Uncharacterized protein n=1 Tax=Xylaria multiplex TaxID=323545 RepID=A0A7C8MHK9_9PEZI|nr:hypothetical protein GQX73_g8776 [Xylaria multiplex]